MYVCIYLHTCRKLDDILSSNHRIVVDHSDFLLSLHGHKPRNHQHCLRSSICRQHQEDPGNRGELAHSKPISALRSHVTGNTISLGNQHKWNNHMNVLSMFAVFCSFLFFFWLYDMFCHMPPTSPAKAVAGTMGFQSGAFRLKWVCAVAAPRDFTWTRRNGSYESGNTLKVTLESEIFYEYFVLVHHFGGVVHI